MDIQPCGSSDVQKYIKKAIVYSILKRQTLSLLEACFHAFILTMITLFQDNTPSQTFPVCIAGK